MRADTEQLRRAEEEMISQVREMNMILAETEAIRAWLQRDTSLDELTHSLRKWETDFGDQIRKQSAMAMALDNICRIYEVQEKRIVEAEESFCAPRVRRAFPSFSPISDRLIGFLRIVGGG